MRGTPGAPPGSLMFKPVLHFLERFGDVVGRTLMTVIYFIAVMPVAIFYRMLTDALMIRKAPKSTFVDWSQVNETLEDARKQD
jgi:hypothetical protein